MRWILASGILLMGCAQTPPPGEAERDAAPPPAEPGRCDAAPVQDLIGRRADQVLPDAERRSGSKTVRVYGTGSPVTMDYRIDRLNLEVDDRDLIVKATCG